MQLFGAGMQCLNCQATQYMCGGKGIRNVILISSDLFTQCVVVSMGDLVDLMS